MLNRSLVCLFVLIGTCHFAGGETIVSVSGGSTAGGPAINAAGGGQFFSTCWTQPRAYSNVSISAPVQLWTEAGVPNPSSYHGTAYLTTTLGPETKSAIASTSFTGANTSAQTIELFSGLTLGPGYYCLTFAGTDQVLSGLSAGPAG